MQQPTVEHFLCFIHKKGRVNQWKLMIAWLEKTAIGIAFTFYFDFDLLLFFEKLFFFFVFRPPLLIVISS